MTSQVWADNLRLPCLLASEAASLLAGLTPPRQSIPFQSKHVPSLKRNVWFALKRPVDHSRTGYLCIMPEKKLCIFVSGDAPSKRYPHPRVAILKIRVDPQFFEAGCPTVMEATLSARERKLWIEDVGQWKGRILNTETFSARWSLAKQWLEHYCIADPGRLGGLEIELAPWVRMTDIRPEGAWDLQVDEPVKRRLRWVAGLSEVYEEEPVKVQVQTLEPVQTGHPVATASRLASPDQWDLTADGSPLGRALIRTLDMSTRLRALTKPVCRVEVSWNSTFKKWEVLEITTKAATPLDYFTKLE